MMIPDTIIRFFFTRYNDDDDDDDDDVSFPCNNIEFSHFHSVLFYQIQ